MLDAHEESWIGPCDFGIRSHNTSRFDYYSSRCLYLVGSLQKKKRESMKRRCALFTAILVISILIGTQAVEVANANPYMFLQFTRIRIHSPQSHVYVYPNVDISFDYYVENNFPQVDSFSYSLDGKADFPIVSSKSTVSLPRNDFTKYTVFKTLENLTNDNHKLKVYAHFSNKTVSPIMDQTIVVDTAYIQPTPFMISPLNQTTYNTRQIEVAYTINAKIFFYTYTLDNKNYASKSISVNGNATLTNLGLTGNTTLTNLSDGSHKLKLILTIQPYERYYYETCFVTVYFNVDSQEPSPSLTPNTTALMPTVNHGPYVYLVVTSFSYIVGLAAIAIALIVGLLVYFKKHKPNTV